ncbi:MULTISPECIES: hypothetical protein [unclassified Halomonas]|uniref:hypothetical protein n=1 Tax=unclassified Halomonas TaxID=2609666 RepID=UPI0007D9872F|nr:MULTISPECIES: hypothetical protein [unclassified Halomonas]MBT2788621.1 hypothetical protein [Halomonas sp. ISL-106]MBT2798212.1 hypothetical protein [Halomonas sp. ISL-104]OAL60762.1 hypothetical protein A6R74_18795 [Halomonas sp. ALS9]
MEQQFALNGLRRPSHGSFVAISSAPLCSALKTIEYGMKIGLGIVSVVLLVTVIAIWFARVPFTYDDMDLNQDGWLGLSEAMYFFDHGVRKVTVEGEVCTEYYALKDGLPLKVVCEN